MTERADRLARFENPEKAFRTPQQIQTRDMVYTVSGLHSDLDGFGIVVASSNNGAVENVSRELPSVKAVGAEEVRSKGKISYFTDVSDGLIVADVNAKERSPGATWGMIAAVLGHAGNKNAFVTRFWGHDAEVEEPDQLAPDLAPRPTREFPKKLKNPFIPFPRALAEDMAAGAIKPWTEARDDYKATRVAAEAGIALRQRQADQATELWRVEAFLRELDMEIHFLEGALDAGETRNRVAQHEMEQAVRTRDERRRDLYALQDYRSAKGDLERIEAVKPEHDVGACEAALQRAGQMNQAAQAALAVAQQDVDDQRLLAPGLLWRIFWPFKRAAWQKRFALTLENAAARKREQLAAGVEKARMEELLSKAKDWTTDRGRFLAAFAAAMRRSSEIWGNSVPPLPDVQAMCLAAERRSKEADAGAQAAVLALSRAKNHLEARLAEAVGLHASKADIEQRLCDLGVSQEMRAKWTPHSMDEDTKQKSPPWHDEALWALRYKTFVAALELHKSFLAANQVEVLGNFRSMMAVLTGNLSHYWLRDENLRALWNTLFLAIPVVSTTFASLGRLFDGLGRESLGWLFIDEAGQATPQAAVGGIWRARRTVVVGDPLQIEPVVTIPENAIDMLRERCGVSAEWHPIRCSAQVLADRANRFGTKLDDRWLGAPLRVHRRCRAPMFGVANAIAYDNMMIYGTQEEDTQQWLGDSCWVDVPASNADGHWIPAQGDVAGRIVLKIAAAAGLYGPENEANVYVISPFKKVATELRKLLINRREIRAALQAMPGEDEDKLANIVGTVHTFQGKEAPVVVLLLGCDPARPGAITKFAAKSPNILNVALTRAKARIYVVGDYRQWSNAPYFRTLAAELGRANAAPVSARVFAGRAGLGPTLLESPPELQRTQVIANKGGTHVSRP